MTDTVAHEFWRGARKALPAILSACPFGALFGALAVDNGLTVSEAMMMSATVFAGASQMVGIELFGQKVHPWLIVLSIFAVNVRMVLYSASIARHIAHFSRAQKAVGLFLLTDPHYAETERRADATGRVRFAWFIGYGIGLYVPWQIATALGAVFARLIGDPAAIGLDVLLPIYFLSLVMGFRQRRNWLPVVVVSSVVSVLALKVVGSPWHVSVGAIVGMMLAACLPLPPGEDETRTRRQDKGSAA